MQNKTDKYTVGKDERKNQSVSRIKVYFVVLLKLRAGKDFPAFLSMNILHALMIFTISIIYINSHFVVIMKKLGFQKIIRNNHAKLTHQFYLLICDKKTLYLNKQIKMSFELSNVCVVFFKGTQKLNCQH